MFRKAAGECVHVQTDLMCFNIRVTKCILPIRTVAARV